MKLRIVQSLTTIFVDANGLHWSSVVTRLVVVACAMLGQLFISPAFGDEVIVNVQGSKTQSVGDFSLTPGAHRSFDMLPMPAPGYDLLSDKAGASNQTNQFTAGQLWSYYDSQGIKSLDRIALYMDVGKLGQSDRFSIESMEFRITGDSDDITQSLMDRNQDNRVVIPGYETLNSLPVARMEIQLDYDFMQRFSRDSTETIMVNMDYQSDSTVRPTFFIEGKARWFSVPNMFLLGFFLLFWIVVFWILQKLTLKSERIPQFNRKSVGDTGGKIEPSRQAKSTA